MRHRKIVLRTTQDCRRRGAAQCALASVLLLGGCGSIFDPAPFEPADAAVVPSYTTFGIASDNLKALVKAYQEQRDKLVRQKLLFDVPMFGLGVAAAANGIFHGAQTATLALGLGSAGVAGGTAYFAPQSRIGAYNNAQQDLLCALSVAVKMKGELAAEQYPDTPANLITKLTADINEASTTLTTATSTQSAALLAARDAAKKALADITESEAQLLGGPAQLESFAATVIKVATAKELAGTENITAALAALPKPSGSTPGAAPAATPAPAPRKRDMVNRGAPLTPPAVPPLIDRLNADASTAELVSKRVTAAWSGFAQCSTS